MAKKIGKKLLEFRKKIANRPYFCKDACDILITNANARESVDVVFVLGIDGRKSDQVVKGLVQEVPAGLGKKQTIALFTKANIEDAKKAGADFVGFEDLFEQVKKEEINCDIFMATIDVMPELAKMGLGRILKGKMPNPKFGTVIDSKDIEKALKAQKAGQLAFRSNGSLIHASIGRASFSSDDLTKNFKALFNAVIQAKPTVIKPHSYIKRVFISTTMGPSIKIDFSEKGATNV